MSDYISREELLKRRHGCNRNCSTCDFATDGDNWCQGELFVVDVLAIPAADVRPVVWKSVREHTPVPGRYLTCRKSMTIPPSYYCSILSYTDNLESIDEYDFAGENIPGWFEYDSEYGHYSCDNVEWYMPLPPMPPNCGADMREEQT